MKSFESSGGHRQFSHLLGSASNLFIQLTSQYSIWVQISHSGDKRLQLCFNYFQNLPHFRLNVSLFLGSMIFSLNKMVHWHFIEMLYFWNVAEIHACLTTYFDQEEGDAIRPQRPCQFDIFHFCFDFCHLSTVFVILQIGSNMYSVSAQLVHNCQTSWMWNNQHVHFLNEQCDHTWNTFFSAPLCFMYSLGRNSFRLGNKWNTEIHTKSMDYFFCYSLKTINKDQFHELLMMFYDLNTNVSICTFMKGWILLLLVNFIHIKLVLHLRFCKESGKKLFLFPLKCQIIQYVSTIFMLYYWEILWDRRLL